MVHGRGSRWAIAGWLAGVSLVAAGCAEEPEPGPDVLRSIGPVVFTHEDGISMIVSGPSEDAMTEPFSATLVTVGRCMGVRIGDQEMVAVWPTGTALLPAGEMRLPGGAAVKPGDEFEALGAVFTSRLPGSVPAWPEKCPRAKRVPMIGSVASE